MKAKLDSQSRQDLVKYRIEKSDQAFQEAHLMASNNYFESAVSRLYYACFYAACALLIKHEIETDTHRAVKTMLSLKFVKTGLLDQKHIKTYSDLLNGRQLSDYEDFYYQDKESYDNYKDKALEFTEAVKKLIT